MTTTTSLNPAQAALQITRAGGHWGTQDVFGVAVSVSYAYGDNTYAVGNSFFSQARINAAEKAFALWEDVAKIDFTRVGTGNTGAGAYSNNASILLFEYSSTSDGRAGGTGLPGNPGDTTPGGSAGNVGINIARSSNSTVTFGTYGYTTLIHEIGHAIGLQHPGGYDALPDGSPPILYSTNAEYIQDSWQYTIMSYFDETNTGANYAGIFASTPLVHDIAAAQRLYGANFLTRSGNTTYGFNANTARDEYHIDSAGEQVVFAIWDGGGRDKVDFSGYSQPANIDLHPGAFSSVGGLTKNVAMAALYNGDTRSLIEDATGGSGGDTIVGNNAVNTLRGNGGNDILDGGGFDNRKDTLIGGLGDDTYRIDNGDIVVENGFLGGNDTVEANFSGYTLPDNVENLRVVIGRIGIGNDLPNTIWGNSGPNDLRGLGGNDYLDGRGGVDILEGGRGNDTYYVDNAADYIIERANRGLNRYGVDTVIATVNFTLAPVPARPSGYLNVENLTLGASAATTATGNARANVITGNSNNNTLSGLAGDDTIRGAHGHDTMYGGAGADLMDGGLLNDDMYGGAGNDIYRVNDPFDHVYESLRNGIDTVQSAINFTLPAFVENLTLIEGSAATDATGNALANTIIGNGNANQILGLGSNDTLHGLYGSDTLDGGKGADTMYGGDSSDDYFVDNKGDRPIETALGGGENDQVETTITFTLPRFIERLNLLEAGGAINGTGNGLVNTITGNSARNVLKGAGGNDFLYGFGGNDVLDGGAGADTMNGGAGNDTYYLDSSLDIAVEIDNSDPYLNVDTLLVRFNFSLVGTFFENLTLLDPVAGTAGHPGLPAGTNATGNELDNVIIGNKRGNTLSGLGGSDTLDGLGGNDTMIGGEGDDTYHVRDAGDVIQETGASLFDAVVSYLKTYTLVANVEFLYLAPANSGAVIGIGNGGNNYIRGNGLANLLAGGAGNDMLTGSIGTDTLVGGEGEDIFYFEEIADHGDTVNDFVSGVDSIGFASVGFHFSEHQLLIEGDNFVSGAHPTPVHDGPTILMNTSTHQVSYAYNGITTVMATLNANALITDFYVA